MPNKVKLSDVLLRKLKPQSRKFLVWDTFQRGLAIQIQPSGYRAWKVIYSRHGRPRWFHLGAADAITLTDARKLASRVMFKVAEGQDPQAERKAERSRGTFGDLATQYVETYARKNNKSWQQADALVRRHLLPRWGKLPIGSISRSDVKTVMAGIASPSTANQTLSAAPAIFSWAIKEDFVQTNPCTGVDKNEMRSRERIFSDSEIPVFWEAFDSQGLLVSTMLKLILLTGQRPGEIRFMRSEHVVDGWWQMPGDPDPKLDWPGTKNAQSHRVWLSEPVRNLLDEVGGEGLIFGGKDLTGPMREIRRTLKIQRATPHDLRRTFSTKVTGLGFGRDALNRVTNHKDGGIASVYDRQSYSKENQKIMETVAAHILSLAEGKPSDNVIAGRFRKSS
jgi:integrase